MAPELATSRRTSARAVLFVSTVNGSTSRSGWRATAVLPTGLWDDGDETGWHLPYRLTRPPRIIMLATKAIAHHCSKRNTTHVPEAPQYAQ